MDIFIPVHKTFVMFAYNIGISNIGISKHEKHLRFLSSGTKVFLLPLSLKVLRHKERDTHSFNSGFFISPPPSRAAPVQGLREQAKVNRLFPRQDSTPQTDFFKNPQNPPRASGAWCQPHSVTPFPIWAIVTSLSDTSDPPARVWTPVLMLHLNNTCTEPKGSQPN